MGGAIHEERGRFFVADEALKSFFGALRQKCSPLDKSPNPLLATFLLGIHREGTTFYLVGLGGGWLFFFNLNNFVQYSDSFSRLGKQQFPFLAGLLFRATAFYGQY